MPERQYKKATAPWKPVAGLPWLEINTSSSTAPAWGMQGGEGSGHNTQMMAQTKQS